MKCVTNVKARRNLLTDNYLGEIASNLLTVEELTRSANGQSGISGVDMSKVPLFVGPQLLEA